jgi:hypothetical protein
VPGGVGVLDVGDAISTVNAVEVIAVKEEGSFGAGGGELVGDAAKVDPWTCISGKDGTRKRIKRIPSSCVIMSVNQDRRKRGHTKVRAISFALIQASYT